jgi:hypothetical protein
MKIMVDKITSIYRKCIKWNWLYLSRVN